MKPFASLLGQVSSHAFAAGVNLRNTLYDKGALPALHLEWPVISIGNLSAGGAGKTPLVMLLGELLQRRGIAFDVLSRGYGRKDKKVMQVNAAGSAAEFGDEPLLLARQLAAPVFVGNHRFQAGRLAERVLPSPRIHLLDDGFQHRALARDFDIVLVTPEDSRDRLLPAGRLREPLSSLRRADVVALTNGAAAANFPLHGKPTWRLRRGIEARNVRSPVVAFCGIARPQNFFLQLRTAGIEIAAQAIYRDHHQYSKSDIRDLLHLRQQSGAAQLLTTEKDAINLGEFLAALDPLSVVTVKMDLEDADSAIDAMLQTVCQHRSFDLNLFKSKEPVIPASP